MSEPADESRSSDVEPSPDGNGSPDGNRSPDAGDSPEVTRRSYALVCVGALSYTCLLFLWFSLPAYLSTIIAETGLTGTQAGVLAGAIPLTYVPLALFSGLAVDRIGPGRSLTVGLIVVGVAQIGRSAATGFPSLLALTVLLGVGATAITFGLPKLVSVLFPPGRTGAPSAIYLVAASAGNAIVYGVGRPVIGPMLGGWRPLFLWSGVVTVGYALVWLAADRIVAADRREASEGTGFTLDSVGSDVRRILAHRELRLIVLVATMYLFIVHGLQGWLPTVLEARGATADRAGGITSLVVVGGVAGTLAVPTLADRFDARKLAVIGSGIVACLGLLGVLGGGVGALLVAGVLVTGVGTGGLSPLVRAIPPDLDEIGPRLTGAAIGFVFAVGEIGGFVGPVLIGTLRDATGSFTPGLAALVLGGVAVAVAGARLSEV